MEEIKYFERDRYIHLSFMGSTFTVKVNLSATNIKKIYKNKCDELELCEEFLYTPILPIKTKHLLLEKLNILSSEDFYEESYEYDDWELHIKNPHIGVNIYLEIVKLGYPQFSYEFVNLGFIECGDNK